MYKKYPIKNLASPIKVMPDDDLPLNKINLLSSLWMFFNNFNIICLGLCFRKHVLSQNMD